MNVVLVITVRTLKPLIYQEKLLVSSKELDFNEEELLILVNKSKGGLGL